MSWTITEPATLLTDYLLAAASLFFAARLGGVARRGRQSSVRLWSYGFLVTALAALVGGSFHGFALYLTPAARQGLWNATLVLIGVGAGFMFSGARVARLPRGRPQTRWLLGGVGLSCLGLAIQQSGVGLHAHFNHNDLYHLVQLGALYLFYRGARLLHDRSVSPLSPEDPARTDG